MPSLRVLTDRVTRERYFVTESGIQLRRTTGALVWPYEEKPGSVVVLGETRSLPNFLAQRRHDVHLLAEYKSLDVSLLCDKVEVWTRSWRIQNWATPVSDKRIYLLEDANDELRRLRQPKMRYGDPLGWHGKGEGLLQFYLSLVQRRTLSEKTLFLRDDSEAVAQIQSLSRDAVNHKPTEYPSAAALWFALAEIDLNPKAEWGDLKSLGIRPADEVGGY